MKNDCLKKGKVKKNTHTQLERWQPKIRTGWKMLHKIADSKNLTAEENGSLKKCLPKKIKPSKDDCLKREMVKIWLHENWQLEGSLPKIKKSKKRLELLILRLAEGGL